MSASGVCAPVCPPSVRPPSRVRACRCHHGHSPAVTPLLSAPHARSPPRLPLSAAPETRPPARRGRRPQAFLPPAGALRARSCWGIRLVPLRLLSPFSRNPRRGSLDGSDHLIQGAR